MAKSGKSKTGRKTRRDIPTSSLKGPCQTCNSAPDCIHRRRRGYDVIHCELYDGYAAPTAGAVDQATPLVGGDEAEAVDSLLAGQREGLCVNCGRAGGCNLPRPAGGVWHCQEYT